jgi:hypothetical protein
MSTLDGSVISMCDDRHRHQEWLKFLRVIDDIVPPDRQVERWLARHPPASTCVSRPLAVHGEALIP